MAKENEKIEQQAAAAAQAPASETPNRDKWTANMRAKYGEDLSEDELYGKSMEGYDTEHEYAKKNREQAKNLDGIMKQYPEVADMYINLADGNVGAAILNIGDLVDAYRKGEIDDEGYKAEVEKRKKDKEELDGKIAAEKEALQAWCEKKGYDFNEWIKRLDEVLLSPLGSYALAEAQFEAFDKMMNYDDAVAAAEVRGKNAKIKEEKRNHPAGDNTLPRNSGTAASAAAAPKKQSRGIFGVAEGDE